MTSRWQAAGFAAKDENVVFVQHAAKGAGTTFGGDRKHSAPGQRTLTVRPVGVANDAGGFVIIKPGAAQGLVGEVKTERLNQVKFSACVGTETDDIPCIGGDFWLVKDNGDHFLLSV
jgi:hypothetical protein